MNKKLFIGVFTTILSCVIVSCGSSEEQVKKETIVTPKKNITESKSISSPNSENYEQNKVNGNKDNENTVTKNPEHYNSPTPNVDELDSYKSSMDEFKKELEELSGYFDEKNKDFNKDSIVDAKKNKIDKLTSFKLVANITTEGKASPKKDSLKLEVLTSKEKNATHMKLMGAGGIPLIELKAVENDGYIYYNGSWVKVASNIVDKLDIYSNYSKLVSTYDVLESKYKFIKNEKVNSIDCKKYTISGDYEVPKSTLFKGEVGSNKTSINIEGEVWIGNTKETEGIIIKQKSRVEGIVRNPLDIMSSMGMGTNKVGAEDAILTTDYELSNIGEKIVIEVPKIKK